MPIQRILEGIHDARRILRRFKGSQTPSLDVEERKAILGSLERGIHDLRVMKRVITRGKKRFGQADDIALGRHKDSLARAIREIPRSHHW